jgi:DNA-binding MarR family transcriptional regulator
MYDIDEKQAPFVELVYDTFKRYKQLCAQRMQSLVLEKYYSILLSVQLSDNCCQQDIAERLNLDKSALVSKIDFLVDAGYLQRIPDKADRRRNILVLTPQAQETIEQVKSITDELEKEIMHGLSEQDMKQLLNYVHIIAQNIEGID